jgi:hypothetical protein
VAAAGADPVRYGEAVRAVAVIPGHRGSVALTDMPEPPAADGPVLVQTRAIGICGTDLEIINGEYPRWLAGLITRQVPIGQWADAYAPRPDDIKTVLTFPNGSP